MYELSSFDSMQIGIASPEKIREWSYGEVTKPETINYRTQKPERDGLFCERIFGPVRDWECHCGKYKRIRYKGIICEKCGVEVTKSKVRRERMGHIELATPVSHIWYFKGVPSRIGICLDMNVKDLEKVLYYSAYVVLDKGDSAFADKQVIDDREYQEAKDNGCTFRAGMGGEAIKELLARIDLDKECADLKKIVTENVGQKRLKAVKRLEILDAFKETSQKPSWMILDVLPVIPPDLRPMVPLDGGRFATSDLNDLYRRVINRNNRLKRLKEIGAPEIIVRNEKRMLQEAVDALIDNGRRGKPVAGPGNRDLKSLSSMLRGKQGRFRQNLLGKRVDYSGRSVIVVGPELKLYQCGLPKEMALELFKPFIMRELVSRGICHNVKNAKRYVDSQKPQVWDILEDVIKDHPVMLNRAPTLHRLGIQAFEPVLVEGRAIKLHPLSCGAFNADFDGDQMAVHVPLSIEAQAEARILMLSTNNILKLSDGKPIVSPTQDMILGSYYLTIIRPGAKGEGKSFRDENEALMAYQTGVIELQSLVYIRREKEIDGVKYSTRLHTTIGRIIFNQAIPQDLGFVDREKDKLSLEIEEVVGKKQLSKIVAACFKRKGATGTAEVLDKIKAQGYKYSTVGALTASVFDMNVPAAKQQIVHEAEQEVLGIENKYRRGWLTEDERYKASIETWKDAADKIEKSLKEGVDEFNPIWMMANSGARGSMGQIRQLCGMRGLMSDPSGRTIELPVKANFREGLSVLEYFISSHGGRKGLTDTALKTADSGYLTRRLVDVAQDVIVREADCGDTRGAWVSAILDINNSVIERLSERVNGRFALDDVVDPKTGEIIAEADKMITPDQADAIEAAGIKQVHIRSVLTCKTRHGICTKCYGKNMASGNPVKLGEAVGIIAAQSIGEPGTQLTMRTFHSGGVATNDDITQGLPRVEELFESRKPKGQAVITENSGVVSREENDRVIRVKAVNGGVEDVKSYNIPFGAKIKVQNGEFVEAGDALTQGSINPQDMLRVKGPKGVQDYLAKEVQATYRISGVEINDKHIEVIVRQMLRKVCIEMQGDTKMLPGTMVDQFAFDDENERVLEAGGVPAIASPKLLGITKAALATDSFLSASSFQETARVLTEAAIKNKTDPLLGLKENVIIGKLIPAGTGMKIYRNITTVPAVENKIEPVVPEYAVDYSNIVKDVYPEDEE